MVLSERIQNKLKGREETQFKWLEKKDVSSSFRKKSSQKRLFCTKKIFYSGFKFGSYSVIEGDCVFVQMVSNFGDTDQCHEIARVVSCFDNGEQKDSMKLIVQWYTRADHIKRVKKLIDKDLPPLDNDNDVVKDFLGYDSEIDIETLSGLCYVLELPATAVPHTIERPEEAIGPFFTCRFNHIKKKPWLIPLSAEEAKPVIAKKEEIIRDVSVVLTPLEPSEYEDDKENDFSSSPKKSKYGRKICTPKKLENGFSCSPLKKIQIQSPQLSKKKKIWNNNHLNSPSSPRRSISRTNTNKLEEARTQLHVSAVPSYLPCREREFEEIFSFVESKLSDQSGGCMYVSGVPGTGKTATVREVVKLVREQHAEGCFPNFHLLEVNAMKLTNPHQLWVQIWHGLMDQKVTADHARALLDKFFSTSTPKRKCVFLLLDELDLLWTRKQDVMYNLFDWSSRIGSKLIVVAIANTMDLPERIMISRVSSRLGLTRMTFQPYTFAQLQEIINSRLKGIEAFDPDAVQFVSRKVAAVSGDARRALDICRRATEIAERNSSADGEGGGGPPQSSPAKSQKKKLKERMNLVGMDHVIGAIEEMFTSPKIKAIKCCSAMEKLALRVILAEFLRTGLEETSFKNVLIQLESTTRFEGIVPPSSSEALFVLGRLASQRLIFAEHSRLDFAMRIRLNISSEDASFALQD